jgi:hypothetical protein
MTRLTDDEWVFLNNCALFLPAITTIKVVMVFHIFWTPDFGPEQAHPWEHI